MPPDDYRYETDLNNQDFEGRCEICGYWFSTDYLADNGWCWNCIDEHERDESYQGGDEE